MTAGTDIARLADRFRRALDDEDYDVVKSMLTSNCHYHARNGILVGREAIVASYRDQSKVARRLFDAVEYASVVTKTDDQTAVIMFSDRLLSQGKEHVYRCHQMVHFGPGGLIDTIKHQELPDQREQLLRFCNALGICLT